MDTDPDKDEHAAGHDAQLRQLRNRVNRLRALCMSASGWLLDAGDYGHSRAILDLIGNMEPTES